MEFLNNINTFIFNILNSMGAFAPVFACVLMLVQSILPVMPLAIFITINFLYFGHLVGFIISWALTCIGCYISFKLCRNILKKHFDKILERKWDKLKRTMKGLSHLKLEQIAVILAMPFTPAFVVNIAAGFSNMDEKRFLVATLIGKLFMVYFWGFIGTSLIDSLKEPIILIKIAGVLLIAFIISKIINKRFKL